GNPLHLHANDSNCAFIVSVKLTGVDNYRIWASAMKLALQIKHKMGFVKELDVYLGHVFSDDAESVWKELHETYDRIDESIVFNFSLLTREILPKVKDAFVIISREESHRGMPASSIKSEKPQVFAFVSRTNDNNRKTTNGNWSDNNGSNVNKGNSDSLLYKELWFKRLLKKIFDLVNISELNLTVGHPNGTLTKINHVGNLRLSSNVVWFDVLVNLKKGKVLGTGNEFVGLYLFDSDCPKSAMCVNRSLNLSNIDHNSPCEVCRKAKQTRESFPLSEHKSTCFGELIHLDVLGPYKVVSRDGFRYFLSVVNDFSRAL
ncbi:ribonuclease H-like domain-containing protein, partial [Tanacetum coccineum]